MAMSPAELVDQFDSMTLSQIAELLRTLKRNITSRPPPAAVAVGPRRARPPPRRATEYSSFSPASVPTKSP